jgi:hypothetical protein
MNSRINCKNSPNVSVQNLSFSRHLYRFISCFNGCETLSITMGEGERMRVLGNKALSIGN